jgi:hypothetical protein
MNSKTLDCPERRRLARKLAEAMHALSALEDERTGSKTNDAALSILLDQARTAQRCAEGNLSGHIEEHGCLAQDRVAKSQA